MAVPKVLIPDRSERKILPRWQALSASLRDLPANRKISDVDGLGEEQSRENRVFPGLSTILNGDAVGMKVSVCHRQDGRKSGVVVKRGSSILVSTFVICF